MTPEVAQEIQQLQALDADFARGIAEFERSQIPTIGVSSLWPSQVHYRYDDGNKFPGGFGPTQLLTTDYWTLRARSAQLFETNLYARGIIRRLVTNEINTGLHLEATPEEAILGFEEDALTDWSETVENRFHLWEKNPHLCDHFERCTFGSLQAQARMEALISGDVLVVLRQDRRTMLPRIQLIRGSAVRSPLNQKPRRGHRIRHGVELDAQDRQVAYWVVQKDRTWKRMPAVGEKSGRRLAWLIYGTEKRLDDVRGKPILSLVLQSLHEIDRYRDSVQRKAVINSMLAMFIKKTQDKPGTLPITGGAMRKGTVTTQEAGETPRSYNVAELIPGLVLDELQAGEEPHAFPSHGTDEKLGDFEEAIIQAVAWANETPPEILRLAFSNNYSASQAAINEFKIYLNRVRTFFGEEFCQPIYVDWLISEVLARRIVAERFLEAWRDRGLYDVFAAWISADWAGHIKPSTDIFKQARGYKLLIDEGLITRDRAARELTSTKYSKNAKKLRRENEALAAAREPVAEEQGADGGTDLRLVEDDEREEEEAS